MYHISKTINLIQQQNIRQRSANNVTNNITISRVQHERTMGQLDLFCYMPIINFATSGISSHPQITLVDQ